MKTAFAITLACFTAKVVAQEATQAANTPPATAWEQWARETCTFQNKLEPECLVELESGLEATDDYMKSLYIRNALDIVQRARDRYEAERCIKAGKTIGVVKIGMTKLDVRYCGWGVPSSHRSITTASGTEDRWFYPKGRALTFRNLKVVAIFD